jgi:hypothetical protein
VHTLPPGSCGVVVFSVWLPAAIREAFRPVGQLALEPIRMITSRSYPVLASARATEGLRLLTLHGSLNPHYSGSGGAPGLPTTAGRRGPVLHRGSLGVRCHPRRFRRGGMLQWFRVADGRLLPPLHEVFLMEVDGRKILAAAAYVSYLESTYLAAVLISGRAGPRTRDQRI